MKIDRHDEDVRAGMDTAMAEASSAYSRTA
jgi:hypothetical protein